MSQSVGGETAAVKVVVAIDIVVGQKLICSAGRLHGESINVKTIIDAALDKAAEHAQRSLIFKGVEPYRSEEAMKQIGRQLENDDLPDMTVADLRDSLGRFLKVHAVFSEVEAGVPQSLPSGLEVVMQTQQQQQQMSGKSSGKQLRASSMTRQSIKMFTSTLSPSTSNAQVQTRKLAAGVSAATQAAPTLRSAAVGTPKVRTANTGTDALSVTVVDRGSQCTMKADRLELAACMQQVRELKEQLGASELERALAESARDALEADVKQFQAAIVADQPVFFGGKHYMAYCMGDMPQLDSDDMRSMLDQGAHVMSS